VTGGTSGGGSGPYKASYPFIASLPRHTVYQQDVHTLPALYTLPVILWANGCCRGYGGWFSKVLAEIPLHGYFIANRVAQRAGIFSTTKNPDITNDIDWIYQYAGQE
jgi:hypothetical protein